MDSIYLFEVYIKSMTFESALHPFPEKSDLEIIIKFANNSIFLDTAGLDDWPEEEKKYHTKLPFNLGKSLIFTNRPSKLLKLMYVPIEVIINDSYRAIGNIKIPWLHFENMLIGRKAESQGPCKVEGEFNLSYREKELGSIDLYIRLSVFGTTVESAFCIKEDFLEDEKYLFSQPNINEKVHCKKVMSEECPISKQVFRPKWETEKPTDDVLSWAQLFKTNLGTRFSMANPEFGLLISTVSAVSMMTMGEKPNEKKVKEICEMIEHVVLDLDKEENPDIEILTLEKILQKCCQKRDCKGVDLFRKAGIVFNRLSKPAHHYEPDDQPRNYGISRAFGKLELHGPETKYRRPKRVYDPYQPPSKC